MAEQRYRAVLEVEAGVPPRSTTTGVRSTRSCRPSRGCAPSGQRPSTNSSISASSSSRRSSSVALPVDGDGGSSSSSGAGWLGVGRGGGGWVRITRSRDRRRDAAPARGSSSPGSESRRAPLPCACVTLPSLLHDRAGRQFNGRRGVGMRHAAADDVVWPDEPSEGGTRMDRRLRSAVDASVGWYEDLCTLHGVGSMLADRVWSALDPPPPLHSDAVVVEPGASRGHRAGPGLL
jgi:hypothetical protein